MSIFACNFTLPAIISLYSGNHRVLYLSLNLIKTKSNNMYPFVYNFFHSTRMEFICAIYVSSSFSFIQ